MAVSALVGLLGGVLFLLAPAASAQTGYPPGTCTVLTGTQDVGTVVVGQRFIVQLAPVCVFTAGAPLAVTVNGVNIPGKVADASGAVRVDITALSATQLSIDDPVLAPAVCGVNTVTARGPSAVAGGQTVTQTATFTLNCGAGSTTGGSTTGGSTTGGSTTGGSTTGGSTTGGSTTGGSTVAIPGTGRLSLTGANIARWLIAALGLLAVGSFLVLADRRRHRVRDGGLAG